MDWNFDISETVLRTLKSLWACLVATTSGYVLWLLFTIVLALLNAVPGVTPSQSFAVWSQLQLDASPVLLCLFALTLIVMVAVGLPIQALLQLLGRTGWLSIVLVAVILGAACFQFGIDTLAGVTHDAGSSTPSRLYPEWMAGGALAGAWLGAIVWWVRRPDKD